MNLPPVLLGKEKKEQSPEFLGRDTSQRRDLEIGETAKIASLTNHGQASATGILIRVLNLGSQQATQVFIRFLLR